MWRGLVLSASLMTLFSQVALAQGPADPAAEKLPLGKYLQLHVSGGRIIIRQREAGQSRTVTAGDAESAYRQHLQLQVKPPCVLVEYEAVDPQGRLTLQQCERRNLKIERTTSGSGLAAPVRYEQPWAGSVRLIVAEPSPREYVAASLWHLIVAHPHESREHLFPLLESISPDWDLRRQADELTAMLLATAAEADVASDEKCWTRLVDDLASDQFARRQAADAELRQAGLAAAAFLARLDRRTLNAEQAQRVQRICQLYADGSPDTLQRAAIWLLGDRSAWLSLLSSEQCDIRAAAAEHLSRLCGRTIAFEPQADPKSRELQVAELTRRIGAKK